MRFSSACAPARRALFALTGAVFFLAGCHRESLTVYVAEPAGSAAQEEVKSVLAARLPRLSGGSTVTVLVPATDGGSPTRALDWTVPQNLTAREREAKAREVLGQIDSALGRVVFSADHPLSDTATIWASMPEESRVNQSFLLACALSRLESGCPSSARKSRVGELLVVAENDRPQIAPAESERLQKCLASWGASNVTVRLALRASVGERLDPAQLTLVNHTRSTDTLTLIPETGSARRLVLSLLPGRKGTLRVPPGTYTARLASGSALFPDIVQRTRFRPGIAYSANYRVGGSGERLRIGETIGF